MPRLATKSIKVSNKCHTYLKAIIKASEIDISQFLDDFVVCFFENVCAQYPNGFSINYLPSVSGSYIMIQALSNKNRILQSGTFKVSSNKQVQELEQQIFDNCKVSKGASFSSIAKQMSRVKQNNQIIKNKNQEDVIK
jgi:hypothetical protein